MTSNDDWKTATGFDIVLTRHLTLRHSYEYSQSVEVAADPRQVGLKSPMETHAQGETSHGTPASHQNLNCINCKETYTGFVIQSVLHVRYYLHNLIKYLNVHATRCALSTMCCVLQRHVDTPSLGILQCCSAHLFEDGLVWCQNRENDRKL